MCRSDHETAHPSQRGQRSVDSGAVPGRHAVHLGSVRSKDRRRASCGMGSIMIKRSIKRTAAALFPQSDRHSVILAYHSIGRGSRFSQPVESFEEQMKILAERFTVVPIPAFLGALQKCGERLAAITFDDGFEDLYACAFPILRKRGFPFTVFLTTGFPEGDRGFFEWSPHYAGLAPLTLGADPGNDDRGLLRGIAHSLPRTPL